MRLSHNDYGLDIVGVVDGAVIAAAVIVVTAAAVAELLLILPLISMQLLVDEKAPFLTFVRKLLLQSLLYVAVVDAAPHVLVRVIVTAFEIVAAFHAVCVIVVVVVTAGGPGGPGGQQRSCNSGSGSGSINECSNVDTAEAPRAAAGSHSKGNISSIFHCWKLASRKNAFSSSVRSYQ